VGKYSQRDEERVILEHFGDRVGRFLDVGAYDPKQFSNVRALWDRGWSGVFVEPSPDAFQAFMAEYGGDCRALLVNVAVNPQPGLKGFSACADGVSTLVDAHRDKWAKGCGTKYTHIVVNTASFAALLAFTGIDFDFVSLDVEGGNWDLTVSVDWTTFRPEMVCAETDGRFDDLVEFFKGKGYREVHRTNENLIVVRED